MQGLFIAYFFSKFIASVPLQIISTCQSSSDRWPLVGRLKIPSAYFTIFHYSITTLQLFKKKISYRTLWCIISLPTKYTKESDPVRQTHYTTKRTWLVDFINIFPSILKRFLPLPRRLYSYWLYPYLPWNRRIPSVPSTDIFCLPSPKSHWLLFIMPVPTPKQTIPDSWM